MSQIEREIKLLNVDVEKIKFTLKKNGIEPKWAFIQDIYTFDLPTTDELYNKYVTKAIKEKDIRGLIKLISEVRPCFDKKDICLIKKIIGTDDLLTYVKDNNDLSILKSDTLFKLMKKTNKNFSKWVRLRQTGKQTTLTIKKIVNSKGEYELDAVDELEFDVPNIESGKQFLEDLGYFFARHQIKMRIAYDYKDTEIVIDKWPRLEPYVEVEGPSQESIDEAVKMLGFNVKDSIVINTDDVYLKNGIDIYAKDNNDLSFNEQEKKQVEDYMQF